MSGAVASSPPRRRGRPRKDARPDGAPTTKQLILAAAAEMFAGRGFDGASLVDIASAAGVTTGAVYRHFRGKPELLLDVVASTLDAVDPLRRIEPDADPHALRAWIDWLLEPGRSQLRSLIIEINQAGARDPEVRTLLLDYARSYARRIAELVERWQARGLVAADRSPTVVAQLFLSTASGLCVSGSLRPEVLADPAFRRLVASQIDALVGITALVGEG
jgi:AcrR family transcriptional regulator